MSPQSNQSNLKTENAIPNRKIRFMAYAGAITTIVFIIVNRIFNIEVSEADIASFVTAAILVVTSIMSVVGYYTRPESGDGTIIDPK